MELKALDINSDREICREAEKLYRQAFPREERLPWWVLRLQARRKGIELTAWMDGDTFCGFTSSVTVQDLHFVLFLAVAEDQRCRGRGSAILSQLTGTYGSVVLNIELLDREASNYDQRLRRLAFYEKNGFRDTGWFVWEVGGQFRVLSSAGKLDVDTYRKVFRRLSFGLWRVKLLQDPKGAYYTANAQGPAAT